jgi:hypothetical protein
MLTLREWRAILNTEQMESSFSEHIKSVTPQPPCWVALCSILCLPPFVLQFLFIAFRGISEGQGWGRESTRQ